MRIFSDTEIGPVRTLLVLLLLVGVARAETPLQLFERTWSLVETDFVDPNLKGLDSKAIRAEAREALSGVRDKEEAVRIINGFLGRLQTSHTRLYCDQDPLYYELLDVFSEGSLREDIKARFRGELPHYTGILCTLEEGRVVDVVPGGPADQAQLWYGDHVLGIANSPEGPFLPYHPIRSLLGKAGQDVYLQVASGKVIAPRRVRPVDIQPKAAFLQAITDSVDLIERGAFKLGYLRVYSYASEDYHRRVEELLEEGPLAEADGLVWDLRGGWGGAQARYLETFQPLPQLSMRERGQSFQEISSGHWGRPVVMVVNERSRSGKEILAYGFQSMGLGPLVGTTTAGAVSGGRLYLLPDGCALYLAVFDVELDGHRLEGVGVTPDHVMQEPIFPTAEPSVKEKALRRLYDELERRQGGLRHQD